MSDTQIDEQAQSYKAKMLNELEKFLNVYNDVAGTAYVFDVRGQYDHLIRVLGKYISTDYQSETWQQTTLSFSDDVVIEFSVFSGSPYEQHVANYLQSLKRAFNDSLDGQVDSFLSGTDKYTQEEKVICREFFSKVTTLHEGMRATAFGRDASTDSDLMATETIAKYKEALREYNSYMTYVAKNKPILLLIQRFDSDIRTLATQKKPVEVLFDV